MHIDYPDWFEDSFLDLREDLAEASSEGKLGLMVLFTTEGCSYWEETWDSAAWQGRTVLFFLKRGQAQLNTPAGQERH
jgi:hypothetical protein